MPMLRTAEFVAQRYAITRAAQDCYAVTSQERTAAAQVAGRFDAEIAPIQVTRAVIHKETGATVYEEALFSMDEGNRPDTTYQALEKLQPVIEGGVVTAGNSSQLSDGASACVLMDEV